MKKICVDKPENIWYSIPRRTGHAAHVHHNTNTTTPRDNGRQTKTPTAEKEKTP